MIKAVRIIGALFILGSFIPLGIGAFCYVSTDNFLKKAVNTEGTVIEMCERKSSDGSVHFYPVYSFVDVYGTKHKIYSSSGHYPPRYEIGDTISIFYDPQNPEKVKYDSFASLWLWVLIAAVLGAIPFCLGMLLFFVAPIVIRSVSKTTHPAQPAPAQYERRTEGEQGDADARVWSLFCHLTALSMFIGIPFGNIIGPLVIWLIKKDNFPMVDEHGKESINFQISMSIYTICAFFLCFALIGFLLLPILLVMNIILVVIASIKANSGDSYRYPLTIRFLK